MPKKFWQFRNVAGSSGAELLLYGDISDTSWWGDEVTPKEFANELNELGLVNEITVRINSGGGDVFAAQAIGNLLEQHPASITARIDGLCASAATIVACHCGKVIAASDSTYMVHPVRMGILGYVDAAELQQYLEAIAVIKENIISLYAKKTGREKEEVTGWMDATSWWTGAQAKENGFVDELVDDEEKSVIENRSGVLFVNHISMNLPFDKAPDFIQNRLPVIPANAKPKEEKNMDIKTADDLRKEYPALVNEIEQAAEQRGQAAERQRIQDIEEMALPGSEAITNKAKFVEPVSASDYAKTAMQFLKNQAAGRLGAMQNDAAGSGANEVKKQVPSNNMPDEFLDAIRSVNSANKK